MATSLRSRALARVRAVIGADAASIRQGLAALLVSSGGDLLAGLTLGAITHTLETLPGLLVLVPAAIGMRGNIFGALGSRLGTMIHTGTFQVSRRSDTEVGQNILASLALTLSISLALAVLAKAVAVGFGLGHTITVTDFVVISVVGGAVSSIFVLGLTLAVASGAVRFGWDMDNVAAPLVTAAGDIVTLPSLFLATYLVGIHVVSAVLALATSAL
jgi:mgtE-like transporter